MPELILNQFTRDHDLEKINGRQIRSIETQSVYSYSLLNPGPTWVGNIERYNATTFVIEFTNGATYLVENGKVAYYD